MHSNRLISQINKIPKNGQFQSSIARISDQKAVICVEGKAYYRRNAKTECTCWVMKKSGEIFYQFLIKVMYTCWSPIIFKYNDFTVAFSYFNSFKYIEVETYWA